MPEQTQTMHGLGSTASSGEKHKKKASNGTMECPKPDECDSFCKKLPLIEDKKGGSRLPCQVLSKNGTVVTGRETVVQEGFVRCNQGGPKDFHVEECGRSRGGVGAAASSSSSSSDKGPMMMKKKKKKPGEGGGAAASGGGSADGAADGCVASKGQHSSPPPRVPETASAPAPAAIAGTNPDAQGPRPTKGSATPSKPVAPPAPRPKVTFPPQRPGRHPPTAGSPASSAAAAPSAAGASGPHAETSHAGDSVNHNKMKPSKKRTESGPKPETAPTAPDDAAIVGTNPDPEPPRKMRPTKKRTEPGPKPNPAADRNLTLCPSNDSNECLAWCKKEGVKMEKGGTCRVRVNAGKNNDVICNTTGRGAASYFACRPRT
ncbi:hypothetical protein XA68_12292 [Ophiocordyceps unilateralis]|uniref:Uncharacterized protein n=1 Tax=Ophiocordyceps unilateralis TaxID=268505 RepID=A0A2A9PEZ5_OPHUN|nr:hypothetical protein XA68_12292 [Ophiocordyceps unilateralis]